MNSVRFAKMQNALNRPFLLFSPFLILSIGLILIFRKGVLVGDENKYLEYAQNLLKGFYSPPAPNIYLGVGPGYPIVLMPFIWLKLPLVSIAILNAVFYYFSIIILYKTLQYIVSLKIALAASLFWAFYYNAYENFPLIAPETIMTFLISLLCFLIIKSFISDNLKTRRYILLSGFIFGYIALTKIIFGYVLLFMLVGIVLLWLFNRTSVNYKKGMFILLVALATTAPYLTYTHQLTGRFFYWGTTAGNNMYWMSTPYSEEYGSWSPAPTMNSDSIVKIKSSIEFREKENLTIKSANHLIPVAGNDIRNNHKVDFCEFNKYSGVEQDDEFKRVAITNIKSHPIKYIQNIFSNMGRIIFNYPYSYTLQKPGTLLRLPANGILLLFLLLGLIPTFINWERILFPLRFMIFIFTLYIGGSLTGSAETRMFTVIVPLLLLWISYLIQRTIKIKLKFNNEDIK
jgi:4-amino-4-deoxy-L-arabinose transferase-like glycosyltransferase